jgi:DNA primase
VWQPAPPSRPLPETARRLTQASVNPVQAQLAGRVLAGLCRWPAELPRLAETLARVSGDNPAIGALLDHLESGGALESSAITAILGAGVPAEAACPGSPEQLAEVVSLMAERPVLEAALRAATARFDADPDGAYAEQQRLLKRKLEFDSRLRQMADARDPDERD